MKVLKPEQRDAYLRDGFLCVEGLVGEDWLEQLRRVTSEFVDESRSLTESNRRFDLEPSHSAEQPRIRRLNSPVDQHEVYWEFASESVVLDLVEDLIGPNIKFHHLRHFYVSQIRHKNLPSAVTRQLAGHANDRAHEVYTHPIPGTEEQTRAALNEVFGLPVVEPTSADPGSTSVAPSAHANRDRDLE